MNDTQNIPVHIVAGPLGVGKTTAIMRYVERHAGQEHVAVMVNDFGPVGMDGAILDGAVGHAVGDRMKVLTIPGGCLCCASADALLDAIPKLAAMPGITRLIIEPSGLAMPAQVVDMVRRLASEHHLSVRPTIVLVDAAEFRAEIAEHMPYYRRLVESADVLVAHRADRADEEVLARFKSWAGQLYPAKLRVLTAAHGQLPDAVFDLIEEPRETTDAPERHDHAHRHPSDHHHHDHDHGHSEHADGKIWPAEQMFDAEHLKATIESQRPMRFKGIFRSPRGWQLYQWARGELQVTFTEHRRDNRADWIAESAEGDTLAERLEDCLVAEEKSPA